MKNNININRQPLTQSDIGKGKNFNALLKKYNAVTKPFYKTKFFLSSTIVTCAVVLFTGIYYFSHHVSTPANNPRVSQKAEQTDTVNQAKSFITPGTSIQINKTSTKPKLSSALTASSKTTDAITISDIYKQFDKVPQLFIIASNKDTSITCAEGTIIKIKAHSFLDEKSGGEINGTIRVRVKEYYKLSDILLAKLSTMNDNNILETGGMINIVAYNKDKACVLKKSKPIEISFPTNDKKEDMQLFTGTWTNNYLINWSLDTGHISKLRVLQSDTLKTYEGNKDYLLDCSKPVFDENDPELKYGYHRVISYPRFYEKDIQPVLVSYIVYKDGHVGKARIVRSSYHTLDSVALDCVRHLPKCQIPGKEAGGQPVDVKMETDVAFISEPGNTAANGDYNILISPWASRYTMADSTELLKQGAKGLSYYMFNTTSLGWINCDRFENNPSARVDYVVNCNKVEDNNVSIVFHSYKSILNGYRHSSHFTFWVPENENITLVAIKYEHGKPYLAVKETKTSATPENDLVYQPVTMSLLQTEMEKLDQ
jgi:hypothetical protein